MSSLASRLMTPLLLLGLLGGPHAGAADAAPQVVRSGSPWDASDPDAPPVTAEDLIERERFWPYHATLVDSLVGPSGEVQVRKGVRGVLVRLRPDGGARIDFGRDGVHTVPIARTDLVERANAVRLGREGKLAPNMTHAIGPRLIDASGARIRPVPFESTFDHPGFLSVYASPEDLDGLAGALAGLEGRYGVRTVLFPSGTAADVEVYRRLRALEWPVAFLPRMLSEGYTDARLGEGEALEIPVVQLETREGRLLFRSAWREGVADRLEAALEEAFGEAASTRAAASGAPR